MYYPKNFPEQRKRRKYEPYCRGEKLTGKCAEDFSGISPSNEIYFDVSCELWFISTLLGVVDSAVETTEIFWSWNNNLCMEHQERDMSVPDHMLMGMLVEMMRNVICPCKTLSHHQCSSMPEALTSNIPNLCTPDANRSLTHESHSKTMTKHVFHFHFGVIALWDWNFEINQMGFSCISWDAKLQSCRIHIVYSAGLLFLH